MFLAHNTYIDMSWCTRVEIWTVYCILTCGMHMWVWMFVRACVQVQKVDGLQKLVKELKSSASTSRNELNQLLQRLDEIQVRSLSHTFSLSVSLSLSLSHTHWPFLDRLRQKHYGNPSETWQSLSAACPRQVSLLLLFVSTTSNASYFWC